MAVKRIVPNIEFGNVEEIRDFYQQVLGLQIAMDLGWIVTLNAEQLCSPQLSVASVGGAGAPVPDISIEVEDVDEVYEPRDEDWGVRRFYLRDPAGKLINILAHSQ